QGKGPHPINPVTALGRVFRQRRLFKRIQSDTDIRGIMFIGTPGLFSIYLEALKL
ncbi:hypothetical protein K1T71_008148, partial [Dendrolimus kikuchii]